MSLNDSLNDFERAKLAVWDYPVSDKYTKMWQAMKEARLPNTIEDALKRVRDSKTSSDGFAYLGTPLTPSPSGLKEILHPLGEPLSKDWTDNECVVMEVFL